MTKLHKSFDISGIETAALADILIYVFENVEKISSVQHSKHGIRSFRASADQGLRNSLRWSIMTTYRAFLHDLSTTERRELLEKLVKAFGESGRIVFDSHPNKMPDNKIRGPANPYKSGTLYSIDSTEGWMYYCMAAPDETMAFYRLRSDEPLPIEEIVDHPFMSRFHIEPFSVRDGFKAGEWDRLGTLQLADELTVKQPMIRLHRGPTGRFPAFHMTCSILDHHPRSNSTYDKVAQTTLDDPRIQHFEVYDRPWINLEHIYERLKRDYGAEEADWDVGGPVWQQRKVIERRAEIHADRPDHQLPEDWVPAPTEEPQTTSGPIDFPIWTSELAKPFHSVSDLWIPRSDDLRPVRERFVAFVKAVYDAGAVTNEDMTKWARYMSVILPEPSAALQDVLHFTGSKYNFDRFDEFTTSFDLDEGQVDALIGIGYKRGFAMSETGISPGEARGALMSHSYLEDRFREVFPFIDY